VTIEIVSASAGTGKTHRLTTVLVDALLRGTARPEGVVAITYTKKAAAELASRIRQALLAEKRADLAGRVRDGYLGTIHAVCQRLLRELALEAGLSPLLEPLPEGERVRLFDAALARVLAGREAELNELARRLFVEDWKQDLRTIVDRARENGMDAGALAEAARRSRDGLVALLPAAPVDGAAFRGQVLAALEASLPTLDAEAGASDNAAARKRAASARALHADLVRFGGHPVWKDLLQTGRALDLKKLATIAGPLVDLAERHHESGAFREDLLRYQEALLAIAGEAIDAFSREKAASRVIDFGDMLAHAHALLCRPAVREVLAPRLDLVLVDEFQDTSPIQLAVVAALGSAARRSVWVGDRKQAIFGFQGSDPELMSAAADAVLGGRAPDVLGESHRSRGPLVGAVSELFARALAPAGFPEAQVRLAAAYPDPPAMVAQPALGCWRWSPEKAERNGVEVSASEGHAIAAGIASLLESPPLVRERIEGTREFRTRPATRGDVAVLAFSNDRCRKIAEALRLRDIPARVSLAGLSQTPEAILALAALGLVADPQDGVAALEVSWLGGAARDPDAWLSRRLAEIAAWRAARDASPGGPPERPLAFDDDARVRRLRAAADDARNLSPAEAMDLALRAGGVVELVRSWPDPEQRLANLEALRAEARDFEDLCRARRSASTVVGLHAHLVAGKDGAGEDQAQPTAEDAVTVSTWHGAKGLEWPIVVLAHLDFSRDRSVFDTAVEPAERFDFGAPLAERWIRFWPWPYGDMSKGLAVLDAAERTPEAERARVRNARERLRLAYVGFTRARDLLVLAAKTTEKSGPALAALEALRGADGTLAVTLPLAAPDGAAAWRVGEREWPCLVQTWSGLPPERTTVPAATRAWYAAGDRADRPREILNPSTEPAPGVARILSVAQLAGRRALDGADASMRDVGDAIHAFLAADRGGDPSSRTAMARRLLVAHGALGHLAPETLLDISDALRTSLDARFPGARWFREWPVRARIDGPPPRLLVGEVDLFLELPDGFVLLDHKSFPGGEVERDRRLVEDWAPQLGWYARALSEALRKPLRAAFIHLPLRGELAEVEIG
jgi:ATP-dependent exoDNAse (exonuclease V) beta subunit